MYKIFLIYYQFLGRYKWRLILFFIALFCLSFFESVQPYFYKLFIDSIPKLDYPYLWHLLFLYIATRTLALVFDVVATILNDWVVIPASKDARLQIFRKIQNLDFAFHLSKSTGSLISAFKRGDNAFFDLNFTINYNLAKIFISFFIILFYFSRVSWYVALLLFVSLVVNLVLARFLIIKNIKARTEYNKEEDEISDIIVDNLINYETVKLFAKENWEYKRLQQKFISWEKSVWKFVNTFRLIDIVVGTAGNLGLFFIMLLVLSKTVNLAITTGEFVMIMGFISAFYPKFFELVYQMRNIAKHYIDLEKYFSILNQEVIVKDPVESIQLEHVKGKIEFKNVSFSYPGGKKGAVKNIDLTMLPGQSVAFVGHSGVGKTTLVKLLMRFYDPDKGQILVDGIDITRFTKDKLRSFMGVVPQEPILFNNTIAYNIAYGSISANHADIVKAAKMANLHEFILSLPNKYDTSVGERGVKLSGGQKQRLAIARMILSNPDIIIFDEATSQLDSESEKQIQEAFWKAAKGKTTLIIAHRLSTITKADRIVVMEKGTIAEIGNHKELVSDQKSRYSRFWSLQSQA